MKSLILRGAVVDECLMYSTNTGRVIEIKLHADWSEPVCEAMGWAADPEGFKGGNLDGKLFGVNLILEPSKKDLKDYRMDIPIGSVGAFRLKTTSKNGDQTGTELCCTITTQNEDAHEILNKWLIHVMDNPAQAKINFSEETQQQLVEEPAPSDGKQRGRRKEAAAPAAN